MVEISASDRATFFNNVKNLPLKNTFLKDLHVLDPVSGAEPNSADTMIRVARAIPKLLSNTEIDCVRH